MKHHYTIKSIYMSGLLLACAGSPALADPPSQTQKVFSIRVDLTPGKLLPIPAQRIQGEIPIHVLTDNANQIVGLQFGDQGSHRFTYEMKDGSKDSYVYDPGVASTDLLSKRNYRFEVKTPIGTRELFFVDGAKLDPAQGGPIKIRYVSSAIFGTTNDVSLEIKKNGDRWIAAVSPASLNKNSTPVSSAEIKSSALGLGLAEARFISMDPNQAIRSMEPKPLTDPKVAIRMMKNGEAALHELEKNPQSVGYGVEFRLRSVAGSAKGL